MPTTQDILDELIFFGKVTAIMDNLVIQILDRRWLSFGS
jgi:hypothetical protein